MNQNQIITQEAAELAGWAQAEPAEQSGTLAVIQREKSEIESAIVIAKRFPRDEAACYTRIIRSCERPGFAEGARYAFPRGGTTVSGPSVQLAREMARCWGNIRFGLRIVSVDDDQVHIRGYALDVETNNYVEAEDRFAKLVQRKQNGRTVWVEPDERDLRELVNRRGAIVVRNALLQVLPPDVTEDAQRTAEATLRKAAKGELTQDRQAAIRRLALAFDGLGVTTEMLTEHLGHDLEIITEDELTSLRAVYTSIKDGNTRRGDHFDFKARRDAGVSEVNARLEQADGGPVALAQAPSRELPHGAIAGDAPDDWNEVTDPPATDFAAEPPTEDGSPAGVEGVVQDIMLWLESSAGDAAALGKLWNTELRGLSPDVLAQVKPRFDELMAKCRPAPSPRQSRKEVAP